MRLSHSVFATWLNLARYKPGDVIIFRAGLLYHSVGRWYPMDGVGPENVTPGRIGHVFFSPEKSLDTLRGRSKGWGKDTLFGRRSESYY